LIGISQLPLETPQAHRLCLLCQRTLQWVVGRQVVTRGKLGSGQGLQPLRLCQLPLRLATGGAASGAGTRVRGHEHQRRDRLWVARGQVQGDDAAP